MCFQIAEKTKEERNRKVSGKISNRVRTNFETSILSQNICF
jgi:hypothetical protein